MGLMVRCVLVLGTLPLIFPVIRTDLTLVPKIENLGEIPVNRGDKLRVRTHRRSARENCMNSLELLISELMRKKEGFMVLTGRVEGLLYIESDGILRTLPAHVDIDGYEWVRQISSEVVNEVPVSRSKSHLQTPMFTSAIKFMGGQNSSEVTNMGASPKPVTLNQEEMESAEIEKEDSDYSLNLEISPRRKRSSQFITGQSRAEGKENSNPVFDSPDVGGVSGKVEDWKNAESGFKNEDVSKDEGKDEEKKGKILLSETMGKAYNIRMGAQVRVKRVIWGDGALENTLILIDGIVRPDLNHHLCRAKVRVKDSRIFLLQIKPDGCLLLAFPPLSVTLDNLREFNQIALQLKPGPGKKIYVLKSAFKLGKKTHYGIDFGTPAFPKKKKGDFWQMLKRKKK
ncbi:unnamed protein product [Allacma fusca]|uniref:Uncharacterized protein n=1 Tax=Allacma fusca TaxID=39272 RepID=A0A8J2LAS7_9HEXA|nr:unnamed protein product [Allacma fusca]